MLRKNKIINHFFPENIIFEICEISKFNNDTLYNKELVIVSRCCEKRKNEFVAGRVMVKNIVKMLGIENFPILTGKYREPIWPEGIVGSISHCNDFCFVAVAEKKFFLSIGIDIESNNPLPIGLEGMVCTVNERNWIQSMIELGSTLPLSKMVFCAKESVYKCIFPFTRRYIDFNEAEIKFQISENTFKVKMLISDNEKTSFQDIIDIKGFVYLDEKCIYTLACLHNGI
jgi:4'-phosphopantetheinyl transferase EntD